MLINTKSIFKITNTKRFKFEKIQFIYTHVADHRVWAVLKYILKLVGKRRFSQNLKFKVIKPDETILKKLVLPTDRFLYRFAFIENKQKIRDSFLYVHIVSWQHLQQRYDNVYTQQKQENKSSQQYRQTLNGFFYSIFFSSSYVVFSTLCSCMGYEGNR